MEASEISGIPQQDQRRVAEIASAIYPKVAEWTGQFPAILQDRVPSVCLACAATTPDFGDQVSAYTSIISLVLFAIDDVADGSVGVYTDPQLDNLLSAFAVIVKNVGTGQEISFQGLDNLPQAGADKPWVIVAQALEKLCREIKAFPAASLYYSFFAKRFGLLMEAMRAELNWRIAYEQNESYPTYQEYLTNGQESIASPTVAACVLAMVGQAANRPAPELESLLDELTLACGASTRLANDIRSFERERLEHKPNSLLIRMLFDGISEKEAEKFVIEQVDAHLERTRSLAVLLPEALKAWGDSVVRLTSFTRDYYLTREFHNFPLEKLNEVKSSFDSV